MTTPLSDERLAEIRAREQAATPGPWDYDHMHFEIHAPHDDNYWVVVSEECNVPNDAPVDQFGHQYSPDYEFIANARQDVPDLLAEVTRLRSRVARLEGVLRSVEWEGDPHDQGTICPVCRQWWHGTGHDHAPDCALDAALRDAHE